MSGAIYYPKADRTVQWFGAAFTGSVIDGDKEVWHTTETPSWPSYGGGASAPHLTYHPLLRDWRQHYRLDRSARALVNKDGGIETNTDHAIQVEIIAYSDEALALERGHLPVSQLSDMALQDLGEFSAWLLDEWGVPLRIDPGWIRSNYQNPIRMTFDQWRAFTGHTGHNRVPENLHWDPARLDIDTIMQFAEGDMAITETDRTFIWAEDATSPISGNETNVKSLLSFARKDAYEAREAAKAATVQATEAAAQATEAAAQAAAAAAKTAELEATVAAQGAKLDAILAAVQGVGQAAATGAREGVQAGVDIRIGVIDQETP